MELTPACKTIIAIAAIVGGYPIVGVLMLVMRQSTNWFMREVTEETLGLRKAGKVAYSFGMVDLYVGMAERFVALVLTVWTIPSLPVFIGGWITLKFAINWKRREPMSKTGPQRQAELNLIAAESLLALVGNVFSFIIAVGAGVFINPAAIAFFAK